MPARGPKRTAAIAALVLTTGFLAACTGGGHDDAVGASPSSSAALHQTPVEPVEPGAEVDAVIAHVRKSAPHYALQVPGLVLLVAQDDETRALAFGDARLRPPQDMRVTQRFAAGSVTKLLVATLAMQLVAEGSIALDDTVEHWLPGMLAFGEKVTVEDLLSHRSGIWDVAAHTDFDLGTDLTDRRLRQLLDHPPTDPPGTTSRYTNPGYWVLGKVIERVTSHPLATELRERVLRPAGMASTVLATDLSEEARLARGYDGEDRDITPGDVTGAWAAGGVVTTAADLARFFDALYGSELLPLSAVKDMATSRGVLPNGAGYGLGVFVVDLGCGTAVGHEGFIDGYHTLAFYDPDAGRTVVGFTNSTSDAGSEAIQSVVFEALCYG